MANPIPFEGQNQKFVAPGCGDLPARIQPTSDKQTVEVVTAWQMSHDEMKQVIANGGIVFLRVIGCQPPVEVTGYTPQFR